MKKSNTANIIDRLELFSAKSKDWQASEFSLENKDVVYHKTTHRTKQGRLVVAGSFDVIKSEGLETKFIGADEFQGPTFNGKPIAAYKFSQVKAKTTILRKKAEVPKIENNTARDLQAQRELWGFTERKQKGIGYGL
jgi:hypothetical protein